MANNGSKGKLFYLYYRSAGDWLLFVSQSSEYAAKTLAGLEVFSLTATVCRQAEALLAVSLPADQEPPEQLDSGISADVTSKLLKRIYPQMKLHQCSQIQGRV